MNWKNTFKEKYKAEWERQKKLQANPEQPESVRNARIGGITLLTLGVIASGINVFTWTQYGFVHKWVLATALGLLGVGFYALIVGKLPRRRA